MLERRKEPRLRAYLGGVVVLDGRMSTAECLVRNISATGVRLQLGEVALLPDEFSLQIPSRQVEFRVRTRWRRLEQIGLEVLPQQAEATTPDAAMMRQLKRLKTQNAELSRRVAELSEAPG